MFQKILESMKHNGCLVHTLSGGALLAGVRMDLFDEEDERLPLFEEMLQNYLKQLPENFRLKVFFKSSYFASDNGEHSRAEAMASLGSIKNEVYLFLEQSPKFYWNLKTVKSNSSQDFDKIAELGKFDSLTDLGLRASPLTAEAIRELFSFLPNEIDHRFQTLDLGGETTCVLRLVKTSEHGIDFKILSRLKDTLPIPYMISVSVRSIPSEVSETMLRRRSKQTEISGDLKEQQKFIEAQEDLKEISLQGKKLFKFEWLCLLNRKNEEWLRADREEVRRRLRPLGEIYLESVGAYESFKAIFPGESPHFSIVEKEDVLTSFLPLVTRGDVSASAPLSKRALTLHRQDDSITSVDIFDPKYDSFSWMIFGKPGTGKSVLTNAITRALLFDPNIKVIKIDVGGSHSRETQILGGIEKTLNLNQPTGLNPFEVLRTLGPSKEAIQILAAFLEVLLLEDNETKLSKSMKAELEKAIQAYAMSGPSPEGSRHFSLQDFYDFAKLCPRRNFLERWTGTGVYSNAFKAKEPEQSRPSPLGSSPFPTSRLFYYNFSQISQAQDPDYAQGGLAAVMAQFNLEMLMPGENKKRIVFIADETPFFIKKCFNFFNLSIANIRKEGHGFITVAQKSADVIVGGDSGILDNSPNRIYFSIDGEDAKFLARNGLTESSVEKIKSLQRKQGEFSEALIRDGRGERIVRIKLSKKEYWSYTSKDEDKKKYQLLRQMCPGLTPEQVIACLSH